MNFEFERGGIDGWAWAVIAPDDVMNACQHSFVDGRRRRRHAAVESARQNGMDLLAGSAVIALARHKDERGNETDAEPVIFNSHERYQDVGTDGCPDALEDGKGGCVANPADSPYASGVSDPNHDDYYLLLNPLGTENDWRYELGEPFEDYGLDGVPNTGDYGENDGVFTESPALRRMESYDPRTNYEKLTPAQRRLIDVYLDGGIRDVFSLRVAATILHTRDLGLRSQPGPALLRVRRHPLHAPQRHRGHGSGRQDAVGGSPAERRRDLRHAEPHLRRAGSGRR